MTRRGRIVVAVALVAAVAVGILTAPGAPLAWCWGGCS